MDPLETFKKLQQLKDFNLVFTLCKKPKDSEWYTVEFFIKSEELTEFLKNEEG